MTISFPAAVLSMAWVKPSVWPFDVEVFLDESGAFTVNGFDQHFRLGFGFTLAYEAPDLFSSGGIFAGRD
jgi:hypothetical protein